ncbi:hypothetical protein [Nostoc sp.]|uniref:hypothetical protein n=1 Tax=Nostoc sp. TaxID=1180 RepID=UPI002FF9B90C
MVTIAKTAGKSAVMAGRISIGSGICCRNGISGYLEWLGFRDYGKRLADFEEEILVRCPQCDAYGGLRLRTAKVLTVNSEQSSLSSIKRITNFSR